MPNTKSANKHLITDEKSRIRNKGRRTAIKSAEKKLRIAVESDDKSQVQELFLTAIKSVDKAKKYGIIAKNKANRKKSQYQKLINTVK